MSLRGPTVNLAEEFTACMLVHTENAFVLKVMSEGYVKDREVVEQDPYISPILASVDASKPLPPQVSLYNDFDIMSSREEFVQTIGVERHRDKNCLKHR